MDFIKQYGWSYIELMVAMIIMSISCIGTVQMQQRFLKQVQFNYAVMLQWMESEKKAISNETQD